MRKQLEIESMKLRMIKLSHPLNSTHDNTGFTFKLRRYLDKQKRLVLGKSFVAIIHLNYVLILDHTSNYLLNVHTGHIIKTTTHGFIKG